MTARSISTSELVASARVALAAAWPPVEMMGPAAFLAVAVSAQAAMAGLQQVEAVEAVPR